MINLNKFKENIKKNIVKFIGISCFCNTFGMENTENSKNLNKNKNKKESTINTILKCCKINRTDYNEIKIKLKNKQERSSSEIHFINKDFLKSNDKNVLLILFIYEKGIYNTAIFDNLLYELNKDPLEYNELQEITIFIHKSILNLDKIFYGCDSVVNINFKSIFKPKSLINLFTDCKNLKKITVINNFDTSNVTDMANMFFGCFNLTSLPDISKWNTKKIEKMDDIFSGCDKLKSSSNISKQKTNKEINSLCMFKNCAILTFLPDMYKSVKLIDKEIYEK